MSGYSTLAEPSADASSASDWLIPPPFEQKGEVEGKQRGEGWQRPGESECHGEHDPPPDTPKAAAIMPFDGTRGGRPSQRSAAGDPDRRYPATLNSKGLRTSACTTPRPHGTGVADNYSHTRLNGNRD